VTHLNDCANHHLQVYEFYKVTKFCSHDILEACRYVDMIFGAKSMKSKLEGYI